MFDTFSEPLDLVIFATLLKRNLTFECRRVSNLALFCYLFRALFPDPSFHIFFTIWFVLYLHTCTHQGGVTTPETTEGVAVALANLSKVNMRFSQKNGLDMFRYTYSIHLS